MQAETIERARTRIPFATSGVIAGLGTTAFVIAAAWYTLAVRGVTVALAPRIGPRVPLPQREHIYYRWLVTTLPQERFYSAIAIAGFLCLAMVAAFARDLLGRDRIPARAGALAIGAGAVLWVTGTVVQLGGHRAVGLMATHGNPIQTTNSIAFTVDMTGQAFALAAFALIGAGMASLALTAAGPAGARRAWGGYTAVLAALLLVTAWSYAAGYGDLTNLMLLAGGVVLLPAWLVWTGRMTAAKSRPDRTRGAGMPC
jgi:hypothetical protein